MANKLNLTKEIQAIADKLENSTVGKIGDGMPIWMSYLVPEDIEMVLKALSDEMTQNNLKTSRILELETALLEARAEREHLEKDHFHCITCNKVIKGGFPHKGGYRCAGCVMKSNQKRRK